jgi:5'-nucleotidase
MFAGMKSRVSPTSRPRRSVARSASAGLLALAVCGGLLSACSSGESAESSTSTTEQSAQSSTSAVAVESQTLRILVSNDDGYAAPGIDAVVRALAALPDTEVVVAAPAENQSGSGSKTSPGELQVSEVTTASGYPATSVQGYPADAVNWALDGGMGELPALVVTGVNAGQNLGSLGNTLSGTIGAARAAAAKNIPALASSTALNDAVDYDLAASYVVKWVQAHRQDLLEGKLTGKELVLQNLNVPVCTAGSLRAQVEVPMSESGEGAIADQDCTSTLQDPADDITAFNNGFVTLSEVTIQAPA